MSQLSLRTRKYSDTTAEKTAPPLLIRKFSENTHGIGQIMPPSMPELPLVEKCRKIEEDSCSLAGTDDGEESMETTSLWDIDFSELEDLDGMDFPL